MVFHWTIPSWALLDFTWLAANTMLITNFVFNKFSLKLILSFNWKCDIYFTLSFFKKEIYTAILCDQGFLKGLTNPDCKSLIWNNVILKKFLFYFVYLVFENSHLHTAYFDHLYPHVLSWTSFRFPTASPLRQLHFILFYLFFTVSKVQL